MRRSYDIEAVRYRGHHLVFPVLGGELVRSRVPLVPTGRQAVGGQGLPFDML